MKTFSTCVCIRLTWKKCSLLLSQLSCQLKMPSAAQTCHSLLIDLRKTPTLLRPKTANKNTMHWRRREEKLQMSKITRRILGMRSCRIAWLAEPVAWIQNEETVDTIVALWVSNYSWGWWECHWFCGYLDKPTGQIWILSDVEFIRIFKPKNICGKCSAGDAERKFNKVRTSDVIYNTLDPKYQLHGSTEWKVNNISGIHHLGILNACTKFHVNPYDSCWDIWVSSKLVDWQTDWRDHIAGVVKNMVIN